MAATTSTVSNFGRIAVTGTPANIPLTIVASATTYTSASGGLPIDLTVALTQGAPFSMEYINPGDVVAIISVNASATGKYLATALVVGTPTYAAATYPFGGGSINAIHPAQKLATCPATIRLYNGTAEFADGPCSETITVELVIARGGQNDN